MNLLIRNAQVLSLDKADVTTQDIGITDDRIAFVGRQEEFAADRIIEANGCLAMPGLVNAHTHASMTLLRNYADDLLFFEWLEGRILPVEEKLTQEDVKQGALLAAVEMIRSGTTTFADMYMFMDGVGEAVLQSGLRANLSRGLTGTGQADQQKIDESVSFHRTWHGAGDGRIRVDFAPHAPYTCTDDFIGRILDAASALDTRIHIHLSESAEEVERSYQAHGHSPIAHMRSLGLFELPTYAAHCVHLSEEDIAILAQDGVSVVNNPGSNLKLANGFAPVRDLLEANVVVALGTDGAASNNNLNMFEEMSLAALVNKAREGDATAVPARTALRMGTEYGARALGLEPEIGTLAAGKKADLILIDLNKPHFFPRFNRLSSLVYSAQASDVKTVLCDGRILMEDHEIKVLDEERILFEADRAADRFKNRV